MDATVPKVRPITIAVLALGGEGGGVLADWIVDLAQHGGYLAQTTSVPGVAQRTGATISAPFAGVHIVEATKQVYRAIPARRERRRLMPALEPALAPSTGGAARAG